MTTLRDRLNAVAERVRGVPVALGERPTTVTIRTRTWAGRIGSDYGYVDTDVVLSPAPKVREVALRELSGSGGRYEAGDVRVGPITPSHPAGGYAESVLAPAVTTSGVETIYVLAGNISGEFARIDLTTDRSHSWFLVLRKRRR